MLWDKSNQEFYLVVDNLILHLIAMIALRKSLGVKKGEKIPASKLNKAAKAKGKLGQRARFAKTLAKLRKGKRG